jgi:hypothetical protein
MEMTSTARARRVGSGVLDRVLLCRDRLFAARLLVGLAAGLTLGACVPETSGVAVQPPPGASADRAMEEFVIAVATAESLAGNCGAYGIRKSYGSTVGLIDSYANALAKQGYSRQELVAAINRMPQDAIASRAVARLKARGVRQGDLDSLCRYGLNEIAAGSAVGKLLRT